MSLPAVLRRHSHHARPHREKVHEVLAVKIPKRVNAVIDWLIANRLRLAVYAGCAVVLGVLAWQVPASRYTVVYAGIALAGFAAGFGARTAWQAHLQEENQRLAEERGRLATEVAPPVDQVADQVTLGMPMIGDLPGPGDRS